MRSGLLRVSVAASAIFLGSLANSEPANICSKITIENCPTLFAEACNDIEFRNANIDACFNAVTNIGDADFCSSIEATQCAPNPECEGIFEPIDRYFCIKNQNACPRNIPELLGQYTSVLAGLEASLSQYQGLTNLDLTEANSIETLCAFPLKELEELQERSMADIATIEMSERSIGSIDQCAATMQGFIDEGAPPNFPEDTWDLIARELINGMGKVEVAQGQIQGNIDSLKEAPGTLSSLRTAYRIICPQSIE